MGESKTGQARQDRVQREKARSELAVLLKEHQEEIALAWAETVRGMRGSVYSDMSPEEVRSLTLRGVAAMADSLETGSLDVLDEYLADVCPIGGGTVPDVSTLTEAMLLCKHTGLTIIRNACGSDASATWALITHLDECVRCMVGCLTRMCTADMAQQLQDERARVQMLLDMAQMVSSTLELNEVVSRVGEAIVAALEVDGCTFDLVDEGKGTTVSLRWPWDWSSRVARSFDTYSSLLSELLTRRQPIILDDVHSDPRIPQDYEYREAELKSALLMPILVTGNVVAVGCAYTLHGYRRFSREEIALAKGMGEMLGLVIRNAQMYEQSKLLTVMEERVRLSREMHDGIAQTLGALQLKASQLEDLVAKDRVGEWEYYLPEVQDMISRAYSDLREAIMGLRSVAEPGAGLVAALREYLTHFQPQYGVSVSLEASEGEPVILDGMAQAQAVRIVQEALSNVRRHSGVSAASLRIERRADAVRVSVVDGGRGFDAALLERRTHGTHLGLRTMAERAASVGGALTVHSAPGFGTRVVLELPLARNRGGS